MQRSSRRFAASATGWTITSDAPTGPRVGDADRRRARTPRHSAGGTQAAPHWVERRDHPRHASDSEPLRRLWDREQELSSVVVRAHVLDKRARRPKRDTKSSLAPSSRRRRECFPALVRRSSGLEFADPNAIVGRDDECASELVEAGYARTRCIATDWSHVSRRSTWISCLAIHEAYATAARTPFSSIVG